MTVRTATSRRRLSALTLQVLHCAFDDLPASLLHDFAPLTSARLSRDAGSPNRGAGLARPPSSAPSAPSSARADRSGPACRRAGAPTGPAHGCPAEDHQQPEQGLPHLLELLLQPVVGRGCRQEAALLPLVGAEANDVAGVADSDCPSEDPAVSLDDDILKIVETGTAWEIDEGAKVPLARVGRPADDNAVVVDPRTLGWRCSRARGCGRDR
jgi:hypothetical protein